MTYDRASIDAALRAFLEENFILDGGAQLLDAEASLTEAGVLDSMGVLELIMFIEQQFSIQVPDEDTLPENLDSVNKIVGYIEKRLGEVAAP